MIFKDDFIFDEDKLEAEIVKLIVLVGEFGGIWSIGEYGPLLKAKLACHPARCLLPVEIIETSSCFSSLKNSTCLSSYE